MKTLADLYREHEGKVSDKWASFLEVYERLFAAMRDQPVRLLEIGIQNGGSLELWSKYFSRAEAIIGCDINPDCAKLHFDDARISVISGDANDRDVHQRILGAAEGFDIILDDGSHRSGDIIQSFALYFPALRPGGIYIAEDLHCSYWADYDGGLYHPYSAISFFKRLIDALHHEHWGLAQEPSSALRGVLDHYHVQMDSALLKVITRVEFANSIAVVHKNGDSGGGLGERVVAGTIELVVPGHQPLKGQPLAVPPQCTNPFSALNGPVEEAWVHARKELREQAALLAAQATQLSLKDEALGIQEQRAMEQEQRVLELEQKRTLQDASLRELTILLDVIQGSLSWKLTAPLRQIYDFLRGCQQAFRHARIFAGQHGYGAAIDHGWRLILQHGWQLLKSPGRLPVVEGEGRTYEEWIRRYDTLDEPARRTMMKQVATWNTRPLISCVMPVYNASPAWLAGAIDSVRGQLYPHWELCIADDASTDPAIRPLLEQYAREDERIKVVFRQKNGHISAASNSALALASGAWIALLDHDDLLPEHALFWVAREINQHPDAALIYSDEDKIDESGRRFDPYFKTDWNPDLFYSHNMICHLGAYRKDVIDAIGGFREGFEGSQDYDLALRFIEQISPGSIRHIPRILYHWRSHAESTAKAYSDAKPYSIDAGERALNEHFRRVGVKGCAASTAFGYRVSYEVAYPPPAVSIIIPTRNGFTWLKKCVDSILNRTDFRHYHIVIIDNSSDEKPTRDYLAYIASHPLVSVRPDHRPFNYSGLNNAAVREVESDFVLLLNDDVEVISPAWLNEMVAVACQPGVGAVGARLLYPDDTLQHAGVVLGIGGVAGHAHKTWPRCTGGYFNRVRIMHGVSAVTGACLLTRKSIYEEVGGLDEINLPVAFNDVDFCIKLIKAGYRNVITPYAELYHHESVSRGQEDNPEKQNRFAREIAFMQQKWGDTLTQDPAYNPNLTLEREDFSLAWPPRVEKC